jgi:hypothetical protein
LSDRPTFEELIEVRRQFNLPHEALVEKDWLVVRALAAIGAADKGPFQLVFQGGTRSSPQGRRRVRRCGACARASRVSCSRPDSNSIQKIPGT